MSLRRTASLVVSCALLVSTGVSAQARKPLAEILIQDGAPVEILTYSAEYHDWVTDNANDGIEHDLSYRNTTERAIVAIRFGLASFNVFDEFIGYVSGIDLGLLSPAGAKDKKGKPANEDEGQWIQRQHGDFAFHTGFAWVDTVRFQDGEVWREDRETVARRLRQLEASFSTSMLEHSSDG